MLTIIKDMLCCGDFMLRVTLLKLQSVGRPVGVSEPSWDVGGSLKLEVSREFLQNVCNP